MESSEALSCAEWECLELIDSGQLSPDATPPEATRLVEAQYVVSHAQNGLVITGAGRDALLRFRRHLEPTAPAETPP